MRKERGKGRGGKAMNPGDRVVNNRATQAITECHSKMDYKPREQISGKTESHGLGLVCSGQSHSYNEKIATTQGRQSKKIIELVKHNRVSAKPKMKSPKVRQILAGRTGRRLCWRSKS